MKNYLLLLIIFSFLYAYPQNQKFKHVPAIYENVTEAIPIILNNNSIIVVYLNPAKDSLYSIKTTDKGSTWGENLFLYKADVTVLQKVSGLMGLKTNSGRLIIALSVLKTITFLSSDDNGATWTKLSTLVSTDLYNIQNINLSSLSDNRILLTANASYGRIYYSLSSDNGNYWQPLVRIEIPSSVPFSSSDLNYVQLSSGNIFGIYLKTLSFSRTIYGLSAPPDDLRTPDTTTIFSSAEAIERPRLTKTSDGVLWIIYQLNETTQFPFYKQYDLYYMKSTDNGVSWSEPVKYTKYTGDDYNHNLYPSDSYPLITFSTKRFTNNYQPALAEVGNTTDENYPPFVKRTWHHETDYENQTINIRSEIFYDEPVYTYTLVFFDSMAAGELYDDGLHNDGEANDYTFGNDFNIPDVPVSDQYVMEVNKIILPLNKSGVLADVNSSVRIPAELNIKREEAVYKYKYNFNVWSGHFSGGSFDDRVFLFSGGFFLGGLANSSQWANGVASASLVNDFQPGIVNSDADDPLNSLYIIRANDPPFGMSWHRWKDAVKLGADFYDGNSDGIYNPVDLNYNGTWDPNEDMPLILGNETVWCVYNDAVPAELRRWDVDPKQIQISQTLFASDKPGFENIIFIRYKIENKSSAVYDSVYFGFWADADIGDATNDTPGCDTLLQSGYTYSQSEMETANTYGVNPPVFFTTLLQGPVINSGNNLDTAYVKYGQQLGIKTIPGLKNGTISSHNIYVGGDPNLGDPNTYFDVLNNLKGKFRNGTTPDPCSFPYGEVVGNVNCNSVNPLYWFSGDPVQQSGWISTIISDVRNMLNVGPFLLEPDTPQDIIAAYVVGRGTDHLNSITVTREFVENAKEEYKNNFNTISYSPPAATNPVVSYHLYQNYPNPFNPVTTIRFEIPDDGMVNLSIYNSLGEQVTTLINEYRQADRYEINFNPAGLASGVYIYRISVNDFIESKKMVLIK